MTHTDRKRLAQNRDFTYPLSAAHKFIHLYDHLKRPNEEQRAILATAYYTLSTQNNISCHRQKMHVNSAITLLKNINTQKRGNQWSSQIARAYFKRAELLEAKEAFIIATNDYVDAIAVLEQFENEKILDDTDRLLLAQSAISIADLIANEQIDDKALNLNHPLYYINKALEHLRELPKSNDDILSTYAYAHQIAGIALSVFHFEEAKEAFRVALLMAFKTEDLGISPLLADIYTCLGLLYEQQYESCSIKKSPEYLLDHAMIYFGLALLFSPREIEDNDEDILTLDSFFDLIYRVLDPYISPLSHQLTCDLIDAVVYAYFCIVNKALPNKILQDELGQPDTFNNYAQHLYWLVSEAYRKKNPRVALNFLEILPEAEYENKLYAEDILSIITQTKANNVYYLPIQR
jgi:tetratricopeptide (TPR) repeat protein